MISVQTILTILGLSLFSYLLLNYQNVTSQNHVNCYENEGIISAISIAQSFLENIQVKAFDENTVSSAVQNTSQLSSTLGAESGESSLQLFDDIDDFDNYQEIIQLSRLDSFRVVVDVYYINTLNPDQEVMSPTFSKRIDVQISNKYVQNPIKLNTIVSY